MKQTIRLTRDQHDHRTSARTRKHVFVVTPLPADQAGPEQLADYIRGHWSIENRPRWVRDVTLDEDCFPIRTGNAANVVATIRNFAISVHRLAVTINIAKTLRATKRNAQLARQLISWL